MRPKLWAERGRDMERIASRSNERVKRLAALAESAGARREAALCLLDGLKLCREAASRGFLRELWLTDDALAGMDGALPLPEDRVVLMSEPVAQKLSYQRTPQGVIGVAALPRMGGVDALRDCRRVAVLVSVQDPANVGTAIRTAAAVGFSGVLLCGACADPFSPKALRASMGAAFAVTLAACPAEDAAPALRDEGFVTLAAALDAGALPLTDAPRGERLALFIGNEGRGLPDGVVKACEHTVYIPITDAVESLNAAAAAAIAMWELRA